VSRILISGNTTKRVRGKSTKGESTHLKVGFANHHVVNNAREIVAQRGRQNTNGPMMTYGSFDRYGERGGDARSERFVEILLVFVE
jgi:hypothetical protein